MRLCLNMIVKDEAAILETCLNSALAYISCWAITDTGSSDNTVDVVRSVLGGLPGVLTKRSFTNFAESRNGALDDAKSLDFDYYLLLDADQELAVNDTEWHRDLSHDAYLLLQKSGGYSYRNVRLLRKDVKAYYVGATHENLVVDGEVWAIDEAFIIDHTNGASRVDKLERDRVLLERELRRSPNNSRAVYYLAQTYRDMGRHKTAAQLYKLRSGQDSSEEAWRAHLEYARCLQAIGKDDKFVHESLRAYARRPTRAEPLYDLARFLIGEDQKAAALPIAMEGMNIPKPKHELGVVDEIIYDYGLRECFYVTAQGHPRYNDNAAYTCDKLSLNRDAPDSVKQAARNNVYFYCKPIDKILSSWQSKRLSFEPPAGYNQMNWSIANFNGRLLAVERAVSYTVDGNGGYNIVENNHSRNFLIEIDPVTLNDSLICELSPPTDFPPPQNNYSVGWEDLRLFEWNGDPWVVGCVLDQQPDVMAEQCLARVEANLGRLGEWRRIVPMATPRRHEKNWMPLSNGSLSFVYSCDPTKVVDEIGKTISETTPPIAADHFRGGSQLVPYKDGYISLVHMKAAINSLTWYYHRFVSFNSQLCINGVSAPFIFQPGDAARQGYQYAMGLCWHPDRDRLLVSYQTDECRSWLGSFDKTDLSNIMRNV